MTQPKRKQPPQTATVRLNQLIARHGLCSRRKADEWIEAGRVSVDGVTCRQLGTRIDPASQRVAVDGTVLRAAPEALYLALNKPRGYVTTRDDPQGRPIVMDLLPSEFKQAGLFPAGRLDMDSEGLLLLTNDGDWSRILLHPSHQVWKEYLVQVDRPLSQKAEDLLTNGVLIDGKRTLPAQLSKPAPEKDEGRSFRLKIREGRNRQIRRMCKEVGLSVVSLIRLKIGPVSLGDLPAGQWRVLSQEEVDKVIRLSTDLV